ncbi:hypothetical protein SteCoe_34217 [Stentor coeruleus]|uniref:Microtubule-associated protein 9 n=1 Tax=Stentor coeruleus TaxID=5963 RepID=A0A1R2AVE8_9CILI|nr:hypothetical protein SteCoe_34217 [Stentor coeruleus]
MERNSFPSRLTLKVDSIVCPLDLKNVTTPQGKLANDEYIRALNDLKIIRETPTSCKSLHVTDRFFRESSSTPKLTFDQWLERKSFLLKLNKKAEKKLKLEEEQKKKQEEEKKYHKLILSKEKVKEWEKVKILQSSSTEKTRLKAVTSHASTLKKKKNIAKEKYHEWLISSLQNLKKLKVNEKNEKLKLEEEKRLKEVEKKLKDEKALQAYNQWLEKKTQFQNKPKPKTAKKLLKTKKIIMLAYSPNRRKSLSLTSICEKDFRKPKSSTMNSNSSSTVEKLENPMILPMDLKKNTSRKSEDEAFEELSSIRKSPKVQSTCQYEEDVESFISELDNLT